MQLIDFYCQDREIAEKILILTGFVKLTETLWQKNQTQLRLR